MSLHINVVYAKLQRKHCTLLNEFRIKTIFHGNFSINETKLQLCVYVRTANSQSQNKSSRGDFMVVVSPALKLVNDKHFHWPIFLTEKIKIKKQTRKECKKHCPGQNIIITARLAVPGCQSFPCN